jgi:lysophospholipase L1-like esterase
MQKVVASVLAVIAVLGVSAWAAQEEANGQPAPAGTVIYDTFAGAKGAAISGRVPDKANAPGGRWSVVAFNLGGGFSPTVETLAGNPAAVACLTCYGNSTGAIAIPIASQGAYAQPQRLTISAGLRGAMPGLGFYSALPVADPQGAYDVFFHFTGLQLQGDGTLALYRKGGLVASVPYTGTFHASEFHTLAYDVDRGSGTISCVSLQGSSSDYAALSVAGAVPADATAYAAIAALCEGGRDNQTYADHLKVSVSSEPPAAPAAPVPAAVKPVAAPSPILIHEGEKIGFMGDSITALGNSPKGYVQLVIAGLAAEGVCATAIPAGHSGDTSGNMVYRTNPDVLHHGADWMTISCGVNDVAAPDDGSGRDLEGFKANVATMLAKAQGWQVRVVLLTATPRGEDLHNAYNQRLAGYNQFLRRLAAEKKLPLADVNAAFVAVLNSPAPAGVVAGRRLLADGLHPNDAGQFLMATTVLEALGVPRADMPRVEEALRERIKGNRQEKR